MFVLSAALARTGALAALADRLHGLALSRRVVAVLLFFCVAAAASAFVNNTAVVVLFIPLLLMYPDADIPCTQLSLLGSLDADAHLRLGEALRGALPPGALLIGSGFSFHNMRAFFAPSTDETRRMNQGFEDWLEHTCTDTALNEEDRRQRLQDWAAAPFARYCHPREEHLLPLHVCYGFAGRAADRHVGMSILGKQASAFLWLAKP